MDLVDVVGYSCGQCVVPVQVLIINIVQHSDKWFVNLCKIMGAVGVTNKREIISSRANGAKCRMLLS